MPGGIHYLLGLLLIHLLTFSYNTIAGNNNNNNNNGAAAVGEEIDEVVESHQKNNTTRRDRKLSSGSSSLTKQQQQQQSTQPQSTTGESNHAVEQQQQQQHQDTIDTISEPSPIDYQHPQKWFKVGLVFGSVLPDVDVLVAVAAIIYSFSRGGTTDDFVEIAELVHRSATHTMLFWVPVVLLLWFTSLILKSNLNNNNKLQTKNKKKTKKISSDSLYQFVQFLLGISIGAIVHVLADTIYLKGVKMFWPWTNEVFFYEIPQLYLFHIVYYSPYTQKMFFVIDHCSEVIFYFLLIMYTDMDRSTLFKLKCVCYAQLTANFACFLIDRFVDLLFHNFVILLYFPGVPFLFVSISMPLLMADQIGNFEWSRVWKRSSSTEEGSATASCSNISVSKENGIAHHGSSLMLTAQGKKYD